MSTEPANVLRVQPPRFLTLNSLLYNRDKLAADAVGKLRAQDLVFVDGYGLCRQYTPAAIVPRDHGEVADAAAMLALHVDSAETPTPRWVLPGHTCRRADDPGFRWHCIAGHGTTVEQWERRPLGELVAALAASLGGLESALGDLAIDLDARQPIASALTELSGLSTEELDRLSPLVAADPTAPGLGFLRIATPTSPKVPQINPDGSITLIDVPSGSGGTAIAASVTTGSTQSIPSGTATVATWSTEEIDNGGCVDLGSSQTRITIPTGQGGLYEVGYLATFSANASNSRYAWIAINGGNRRCAYGAIATRTDGGAPTISGCTLVSLSEGDYVELVVRQNAGVTLSTYIDPDIAPNMWLVKVG